MESMAVRLSGDGDLPFVGRGRELAVAAEILADGERAGAVLIGGESGLGKTRLVAEIVATAGPDHNPSDGPTVVRGGAVPRATPVPFELVRSAINPLLAGSGHEGSEPNTSLDPVSRIRAEAELLRTATDGPTIYIFEDVHWADAESLEVIDRLMVAGPLGASLLITYRPNALNPGHPTNVFLRRAERRAHVVQFRLEPLRREEVKAYLAAAGRPVDPATVEHVHSRTGGNPLLLSELVAAVDRDADLTSGLPWTLAEMLRPEIDRLPPSERQIAEAVAVLGAEVDFDLLAVAVVASEHELLGRLRSLVENGILIESGPDRFGFRHELVREAVAEGLFTREHRRIHASVHDALLAAGSDDVVALVAHATGAGRTKQAADAARDAAIEAQSNGHTQQALAFAEQALLEHTDDIDLLRVAVVAAWMSGQDRTGLHHLERWSELVGPGPTEQAEVLHHRVRLLWENGNAEAADRAAERLLDLAETMEQSPAKAQALADVAQHHMLRDREAEAIAFADRAIDVAGAVGPAAANPALQARAERASALINKHGGIDRANGVMELLAVASEADAAGNHLVASRAIHNIPIQHPDIEPRAHVERMRRMSQRAGLSCMAEDTYRRSLLQVALLDGDREAFESQLESALAELGPTHKIDILAATFAVDDGRFDDARRLAERLPMHIQSAHYSTTWRDGLMALVGLLGTGEAGPLRSWLTDLPDDRLSQEFALDLMLQFFQDLLDAGLQPELQIALGRGLAERTQEPAFIGIRAEVEGRLADAEELYAEALRSGMCRTLPEQTELQVARARVADQLEPGSGRVHLLAAAERLAAWPGRRRDRVDGLLGRSEPGSSDRISSDRISSEPALSLTPREREVAALVSKGLTNGGIAEELFISTKTASVHVSNILAKFNMASRTEIATWVAEGGLERS